MSRFLAIIAIAFAGCNRALPQSSPQAEASRPSVRPRPYLNMPMRADGAVPRRLSEVGAFADTASLTPTAGLVAYDVNVPFWSDGAAKRRWIALPAGQTIRFAATGAWHFPPGTVFIKHFEIPAAAGHPARRLETRVLVRDAGGGVYGVTYRWRDDNRDADLVSDSITLPVPEASTGKWYFPSSRDCRTCHTAVSGGVLGVKADQLNRPFESNGENQLTLWAREGLFASDAMPANPARYLRLATSDDRSRSLPDRARSFLDVNCANCHQPGGVAGYFDARFETPLESQHLIDGPVLINLGIDHARAIAPADVWRSMVLNRVETSAGTKMPPLAHLTFDPDGAALLREWIKSLPGRPVLPPPAIAPRGGEYSSAVMVTLQDEDLHCAIHYTLDGSLPLKSSPVYSQPIRLDGPTTLRARAFKDGMTTSIAVQETFIVGD